MNIAEITSFHQIDEIETLTSHSAQKLAQYEKYQQLFSSELEEIEEFEGVDQECLLVKHKYNKLTSIAL